MRRFWPDSRLARHRRCSRRSGHGPRYPARARAGALRAPPAGDHAALPVGGAPLPGVPGCGGQVRVLACLEDPLVIGKILGHRETQQAVRVQTGRAALCLRGCAGRERPGTGRFRAALPTTGARGFLVRWFLGTTRSARAFRRCFELPMLPRRAVRGSGLAGGQP